VVVVGQRIVLEHADDRRPFEAPPYSAVHCLLEGQIVLSVALRHGSLRQLGLIIVLRRLRSMCFQSDFREQIFHGFQRLADYLGDNIDGDATAECRMMTVCWANV
jgi:hypothetical protein